MPGRRIGQARGLYDMLELTESVSDNRTSGRASYLEAEGMLDVGRKDEILATQP